MSGRAATANILPGQFALSIGDAGMAAPQGWIWLPLVDVARLESGHTPSREHPEWWDGDVPWIGIKDARHHHGKEISETFQKINEQGLANSAARMLPAGTVCLSRTASVGYVVVMGRSMATSQDFVNWVCSNAIVPGWLKFLFVAENESLWKFAKGTTHSTIYYPEAKAFHVCLPPVPEQKRIVAKIESLQARSDAAKEALDAIPPLLEKFRQSVLAAAFRGDLTKQWRAKHPDVEPASTLLARIRVERRRRCEEANPKKKYEEPEPVDTSELPELPEGWCWAKLGWLGDDPLNTVQTGPFGAQLHNTEFTSSGVPVIAVGNLTGMGFTQEGLYFITDMKAAELSRYDVQTGDVLFARSGATLGKVCVAPAFVHDWRMTGHILRARFNRGFVLPEIVVFALAGSTAVVRQVKGGVRGMTRPGYNTGLLENILLPVPPISEQVALLDRVRDVLARMDASSTARDLGIESLASINQSILAKAFRGELVPQDPKDEPASLLLERVRRERSESEGKAKETSRSKKATVAGQTRRRKTEDPERR